MSESSKDRMIADLRRELYLQVEDNNRLRELLAWGPKIERDKLKVCDRCTSPEMHAMHRDMKDLLKENRDQLAEIENLKRTLVRLANLRTKEEVDKNAEMERG